MNYSIVTLSGKCPTCYKIIDHQHIRPTFSKCNQYNNLSSKKDNKNIVEIYCNHCDWKIEHNCPEIVYSALDESKAGKLK